MTKFPKVFTEIADKSSIIIPLWYIPGRYDLEVIGKDILDEAARKHTRLKTALERWLRLAEGCKARHPQDLKQTFGPVDPVPPQTVFDIKGNSFRLISEIDYEHQTIVVTHVLTHEEYDREQWKRS